MTLRSDSSVTALDRHRLRRREDLVRLANVDAVVRRALTGHVTEEMQRHYSTVGLDEKRAAISGVLRLVPPTPTSINEGGVQGGVSEVDEKLAG
jgi:hypothetical protein